MVKKLLRYDFISYLRTLTPMYLILITMGALNRFIQLFENDHFSYNVVFTSSLIALIISSVVCLVMTVVMGITRFYKNLYSTEGYLSFTLPVTSSQHILTKLSIFLLFTAISLFAVLASLSVAMMGDVLTEVFKAIAYLFKKLFQQYHGHLIFYVIEVLLLGVALTVNQYLLYYGCISLGQTAKKNRILMAFGVYFIYYLITQVLGTLFVIAGMFLNKIGVLEKIGLLIAENLHASTHVLLLLALGLYAGLSVAYYFIIRHTMNKKLNLE